MFTHCKKSFYHKLYNATCISKARLKNKKKSLTVEKRTVKWVSLPSSQIGY